MIPKIIHLCWLSGDAYPENIEKCIKSWKRLLPDYEIKVWSKDSFNIDNVQWVKEAYEAKKYAFAADYIRFWALYNYGGIYLDSDVEVIKTFDGLLNQKSFMGFEYLGVPEAAIIGSEKGADWLKKCMDYYENNSFYDEYGSMKKDVVPNLVRLVINEKAGDDIRDTGEEQDLGWIKMYPYKVFSPKNYYNGIIEKDESTISIHRFASAWGPKEKRKWVMVLHEIIIKLIGKKLHDKIYRTIKPFPCLFNNTRV